MKIPLGYGDCQINIRVSMGENEYVAQQHLFHHIEGSSLSPILIANEYETVNHNKVQKVQGYHIEYNLSLIDTGLGSGSQNILQSFLDNFYNNYYDYNRIYIDLYNGGLGSEYEQGQLWTVSSLPELTNVGKNNIFGQTLQIKAQSEIMLTKEQMREFWSAYRDTSDGSWESAITSKQGYVEPKTGVR